MSRLVFIVATMAVARLCVADESEVKYAAIPAAAIESIRRVAIAPTSGEIVRLPWLRPDVEVIATKVAADRAALSAVRVHVSMDGDRLCIAVGERVGRAWVPLRAGSKVNLAIRLPERLLDRSQPLEPAPTNAVIALVPGTE